VRARGALPPGVVCPCCLVMVDVDVMVLPLVLFWFRSSPLFLLPFRCLH